MSKKRILIVDDNEINRALLRKILSSQYDVLEAENGLVALEVLATIQNEVSALLLDLTMPVLDGYELLRRLRASEDSMLIPIIVLTETESEDSELQALALGANDFLKKPYQPDLIRQRLSNMIMFGEMVVRQRASRYDRLTGIYTREMFCIETARMLAEHSDARYTMVCMDVEQFKVINDLFGIAVGDAVLKNIAHTLASYVSTSGTYGRLEGDHFVCCVPSATLNIEILMNCMDASFRGHGFDYKIVCYYGLCEVENSDTPVAQLCDWAALALASIKGNYMKRFAYYDNALREVMLTEQQIVSEMNDALEQHEFTINLQPIYSISMECPVSAEALVRWQHPRRGLISPGVFIPLFERKGFITRLDWFVREQVCCYIKRSKREHPELKIVPISVNLSRMNFYHTEFPNEVIAQTQQYGVLPSEIKFEITESAYTDNPGELLRAMKILQDYGFEIMMDDFGSGYSSLNMLKDVPVDVLKIDMKFVDDIEVSNRARNVMASVVRMAKWLDMSVIAEGVETRTQIDFLRSIGCDRVQGFYFSKPLSLTDFTELILSAPPVRYADGDILEKIDFDTLFYDNREINLVMDGMIGFMGIYELRIAALEVVRVNKGYYELFGNAAFATSRDVMENVMPADRVALLQKCHDAEISLRVERLALRSYRENKIVFWLDLRVRYLGKRNGNSIFYFAGNDITKQKEMEQANAQGSYLLALRNVYDEIFSFTDGDNCLRSLYADAQCINPDMEGIELRLQLESYASRYVHPEDRERFLRLSRREIVFAQLSDPQGVVPDFKVRVLRRDGRYHWILRTILAAGEVFGKQNFLICIRNIDQEYLAEKIAAENQQLRAMKRIDERYRVIAEQTNTIVMDWDLVTGEFFAGEGYEQYEMSVHTMEMSFHATLPEGVVHPQDKDILIRFLEHLENNDVFEQAVLRLKKANGKYVWVRITGTSIFDQMGKLVRVIGTINEVDAEKRSALLLAETKEQLEQLVENLPIGVGIYELENKVLLRYENRQARALLGIEQGTELYSEKCREQVAQHYDRNRVLQLLQREKRVVRADCLHITRQDGTSLCLHTISTILPLGEDGALCYAALMEVTDTSLSAGVSLRETEKAE